jgi:hypothetical protein
VRESADQTERLKGIDYDLSRTQMRIEDTQKLVDARSYDLRNKQILLEDIHKEIGRTKDITARQGSEGTLIRRDIDKVMGEVYELRKEIDYQVARNADVSA